MMVKSHSVYDQRMAVQRTEAGCSATAITSSIFKKTIVLTIVILILIFMLLMVMPIISLFQFSGLTRIWQSIVQADGLEAISLSLYTTAITSVFTFCVGTPVAFLLSRYRKMRSVRMLSIVCQLPIALPPSIAGIALLLFFGSNGIGGHLLAAVGVNIIFTPIAVMIAQFFVSCPLYVQSLRVSVNAVPEELFEAAFVNGADSIKTIVCFIIPMLRPAIVSAIVVSYVRSLGEFGATLLFAGNMTGTTSTMPLHIYTLMQSDVRLSAGFSIVLISIAAVIVVVFKGLLGREDCES